MTDRVFGNDDSTRKVYEESAKEIALSVLNGINCEDLLNSNIIYMLM